MFRENKHKRSAVAILAWVLCFMFVVQIVNRSVYLHSHVIKGGVVVVHAHPFDKATDSEPVKKHHHSDFEFTFFQQLNILFLAAFIIALLLADIVVYGVVVDRVKNKCSGYLNHSLGRAPPLS